MMLRHYAAVLLLCSACSAKGTTTSKCPGQVLVDGSCYNACNSDADCGADEACLSGVCGPVLDAPTIVGTSPASPANDNAPLVFGTADLNLTITIYDDPTCTNVRGVGTSQVFTAAGIPVTVVDDSTTTFYARAQADDGRLSKCTSDSVTFVEDSTPPGVPTVGSTAPGSPANNNSPVVIGSANPGSTVDVYTNPACNDAVAGTASAEIFGSYGIAVAVADDTSTTFYARTRDDIGNASACSTTSVTYIEDSSAPTFGGVSSATFVDNDSVRLQWVVATDNFTATPDIVYDYCQTTTSGGCDPFHVTGTASSTPLVVGSLASSTLYYFVVRARDAAGNSDGNVYELPAYTACAAGYTDTGSGCSWGGGLANSEFDTTGGWTLGAGITIDTTEPACDGSGSSGAATFAPAAVCSGAVLTQTFTMPPFDEAEPFLVMVEGVTRSSACVNSCSSFIDEDHCWGVDATEYDCIWDGATCSYATGDCYAPQVLLGLNDFKTQIGAYDESACTYSTYCLGEADYGGPLTVSFTTEGVDYACASGAPNQVTPVDITEAYIDQEPGGCARAGEIMNGDLESSNRGFAYLYQPTGTTNAIEAGTGQDGSRGLHMHISTRCSGLYASTPASLKSALVSPAIEFWSHVDAGRRFFVNGFGTLAIPFLGTGADVVSRLCVPTGYRGQASFVSVNVSSDSGGTCTDADPVDARFDNFRFVSESGCPDGAGIFDGDVENAINHPGLVAWSPSGYNTGAVTVPGVAEIRTDGSGHAGQAYLHMVLAQSCTSALMNNVVTIPSASGGFGPAVHLFYRYLRTSSTSQADIAVDDVSLQLTPSTSWTAGTLCLNSAHSGLVTALQLNLSSYSGSCGADLTPAEELFVDDVDVSLDPTCP